MCEEMGGNVSLRVRSELIAGDFFYEKQGALQNHLVCCRPLVI
jgi:hypothetical protein